MTPAEFRAALDRLGLSQVGAARLLGYGGRTAQHWAAGTAEIPPAVAILLRLLLAGIVSVEQIEATG